jgi:NADH-quinone oxidoreductase subunit C
VLNLELLRRRFPQIAWNEATSSLSIPRAHALELALFLKNDLAHQFDTASNVTGVDYLERSEKVTLPNERVVDKITGGYLEVVYHLYSVRRCVGPILLRVRTHNRTDDTRVPSLSPVWKGCDFQEREVYDLFGVIFEGHPDLRRILMWDGFQDYPMRRDYVEPDDYEYEPTPHDDVLEKVKKRATSGTTA